MSISHSVSLPSLTDPTTTNETTYKISGRDRLVSNQSASQENTSSRMQNISPNSIIHRSLTVPKKAANSSVLESASSLQSEPNDSHNPPRELRKNLDFKSLKAQGKEEEEEKSVLNFSLIERRPDQHTQVHLKKQSALPASNNFRNPPGRLRQNPDFIPGEAKEEEQESLLKYLYIDAFRTSINSRAISIEKKIKNLIIYLYLSREPNSNNFLLKKNQKLDILEKNIDHLIQKHIGQATVKEDIDALIEYQKSLLAPFAKTTDRHKNHYIKPNNDSQKLITALEILKHDCSNKYTSRILNELSKLRVADLEFYQEKLQHARQKKRILYFLTRPRFKITDPNQALQTFETSLREFHNKKKESELFKKWISSLVQQKSTDKQYRDLSLLKLLHNIYECDVKPIATKYKQKEVAFNYFSSLGLVEATNEYKKFALDQLETDFERTTKIAFGKYQINNDESSSDKISSHVVVDLSFQEFIDSVYWSCFSEYIKEYSDTHNPIDERTLNTLKNQFNHIFAKITLFCSQAGDSEIINFCFANDLYIPIINFGIGTSEFHIKGPIVKKIIKTPKAMAAPHLEKDLVTDGVIEIEQIYNYLEDTTSMHFIRYEDRNGNFLN